MMTTLKVITLAFLWLIFAALLVYLFSLIAYRLMEASGVIIGHAGAFALGLWLEGQVEGKINYAI